MQQNHARSSHPLFWSIPVFIVCLLLVVGTLCYGVIRTVIFPPDTRTPDSFPNTDLVFTTNGGVGFVNADGSNKVYLDFSARKPWMIAGTAPADIGRPVITGENRALIARVSDYLGYWYMASSNHLVLWRPGEYPLFCQQWGGQALPLLTSDQDHILIQTEQGMALYKLDSCGTDEEPITVYENISGVISPDLQYVAYPDSINGDSDDRIITVRNLDSGEERIMHPGDFPAWSRDSHWLAYTGPDGIYVVNILKNSEPVRVVLYENPVGDVFPTYSDINQLPPPEPAWSPDGQWLVYHRLTVDPGHNGDFPNYHSVFKANIETGEEIKIVDQGMYPYWRWPVEEP